MARVGKSKYSTVIYLGPKEGERLSAILEDHKNSGYHEVNPDALTLINEILEGIENA